MRRPWTKSLQRLEQTGQFGRLVSSRDTDGDKRQGASFHGAAGCGSGTIFAWWDGYAHQLDQPRGRLG
ncbi:hypothetical protein FHR19_003075 [Sphingomonas yantingensis]|uniref:Uncharacterized protein n=1 Tax=Sphingomonas yantingensis TaxID=1241761 RepID=A0A7W9AST7_9SPHN|nr:hypothetical protein [Sphingomonas yantingensis]